MMRMVQDREDDGSEPEDDDPVVAIEMATSCLLRQVDYLDKFTSPADLDLISGCLPDIHEARTTLSRILRRFPNLIIAEAAE